MKIRYRIIVLCVFTIFITMACQKKSDRDPVLFNFETKDYSYNNYNIIPYIAEDSVNFEKVDSALVLYQVQRDPYIDLDFVAIITDTILSLHSEEPIESFYLKSKDNIVYKENLVQMFILNGFKTYKHNYLADWKSEIEADYNQKLTKENFDGYLRDQLNFTIKLKYKDYDYKITQWTDPEPDENDSLQIKTKYIVSDGKITQEVLISTVDISDYSELVCIGDVDGDDKLDFLGKISCYEVKPHDEYIVHKAWMLFLSSVAEEGDILKHVATHVTKKADKVSNGLSID